MLAKPGGSFKDEGFESMRSVLDELCGELAGKFNLYASDGRPRRVFVLDPLLRYSCRGCIAKVFMQPRHSGVDALYVQNHDLAVGLLVEELRRRLGREYSNFVVEEEASGAYGRPDIVVRATPTGVIIEIDGALEIIVEVKTGAGFTYSQVFRYLIERPNAVLVLWRVIRRQPIVLEGGKLRSLLLMVMEAAVNRGTAVLNGELEECKHNPNRKGKPCTVEDAQAIVDEFLSALTETMPTIVETVLNIVRSRLQTATAQVRV